ncbi:MAG TPA: hypothetical protein VGA68_06720 [Woeseiaceae bacterium]
MQPVVGWLVARPQNAVIGLAATLMLPLAQVLSGAVMVVLVLQQGLRMALLEGAGALALLAGVSLLINAPLAQLLLNALVSWMPVMLLATVMLRSRSLTLALQAAAMLAIVVTLGFFVVLDDPTVFWSEVLGQFAAFLDGLGLTQQAELLTAQTAVLAPQMTMVFVSSGWLVIVVVLALGYSLYRALPGKGAMFGRFRDLNLGRVLASTVAVASVAAGLAGTDWLQNVAFVAFVIFWIHGLAIVHWLHLERGMHVALVFGAYALMLLLSAPLIIALAVVGYTDAWFDFRNRMKRA